MIVKAIVGSDTIKNKIFIQVGYKPQTPIISELNDSTLISSAAFGNQWYNHYGKISNAVDSFIFVNMSGEYFVQVDSNGCISDISESYIYIHQYNQYDPPCDTITWAGGFDFENWMDPQNWIGGIIPDSCTYVLVPIGSTVRIRDFSTAVAKKLLNMGYIYIQGWGKLHVMGPDSFGIKNVSSTFINNGTVVIENSFYGLVNQNSSFENQNKLNIFGIDSIGIFNNNLSTFSNVGTTLANILPNKAIVNSQSTIFNYGQLMLKSKIR
ncbi:MAG: hypothetical protein IPF52_15015 [Saprospiraceae bacterium]|nr:hypothetical protein [Saprospiraceae bacterium]